MTLGSNAITYSTSSVVKDGLEVKTVDSSSSTRVRFTATSTSARNKWCSVEIPFNSGNISNTTIFSSFIIASKRDIILRESTGQPKLPVVAIGHIG